MPNAAIAYSRTWGSCGHEAIAQHFRKAIKYEKAVLQDQDPEALHQMRVGFRRLGSSLQMFDGAIVLPKAAQISQLRKVARGLGSVRDLDVLKDVLETHYHPYLPQEEQQVLEQVLSQLQKQRKQAFSSLVKLLKGTVYQELKRALKKWLKEPIYHERGTWSLTTILPDLLFPGVSALLLHQGWMLGEDRVGHLDKVSSSDHQERGVMSHEDLHYPSLEELLKHQGECLHDLRKQVKRVRYQSEFFVDDYGPDYQQQIEDYRQIQELLGQLQDCAILESLLQKQLGKQWRQSLPSLVKRLQDTRQQIWQDWQPIQRRYGHAEGRQGLRQLLLTPPPNHESMHYFQETCLQEIRLEM